MVTNTIIVAPFLLPDGGLTGMPTLTFTVTNTIIVAPFLLPTPRVRRDATSSDATFTVGAQQCVRLRRGAVAEVKRQQMCSLLCI
jgi:hypothetical protein